MKNYIFGVFAIFLCTMGVNNSLAQSIDECHPIPQNPAMFSPFVIRARGEFGASNWQLWPSSDYLTISNNHLTIRLVCYQVGDGGATVITPWQGDIPIDGLLPGGYRAYVILTDRDAGTSETSTTAFVVGPLPTIDSTSPSDTNLVFRWMSDPTLYYSVQYSTQLTANSWKYLPSFSNVHSTSYSQMEYHAPMTNDPLRMYRLISTPK